MTRCSIARMVAASILLFPCSPPVSTATPVFSMTGNSISDTIAPGLSQTVASNFARIALRCVHKEYPNKLDHVMSDSTELRSPRSLHPAFYGCYDWHSSVHAHWMLVRLLRLFPELPEGSLIRAALNENLTASNTAIETSYLDLPNKKSFERTYGWAWLLKLAQELHEWNDPDAQRWSSHLSPLARAISRRYIDFLPLQNYPIRTGVHANTAFGLSFALDYARSVRDSAFEALVVERSITYFKADKGCPLGWEPGGEDFLSPCLIEADLMRRVMKPQEYLRWINYFVGNLPTSSASPVLIPAVVTDRTDPKLVHLDGLNLSRAWCMVGIASHLPQTHPLQRVLMSSARWHAEVGLSSVSTGNYEGEHWLASFAVLMLDSFSRCEPR